MKTTNVILIAVAACCLRSIPPMQAQTLHPMTGEPIAQPADAVRNGSAKLTSAYDESQMLRLAFALKPPHLEEERQFVNELQDKRSPNFHHFLTAEQWNARFAPSAEDEQAVVDWAQSQGLKLTQRYPNRLLVDVEAPVTTIKRALKIEINNYQAKSATFYSNDKPPVLPSHLIDKVWGVMGLNSLERERPTSKNASSSVIRPDYSAGPVRANAGSARANGDLSKLVAARKRSSRAITPFNTEGGLDPTDIYSSQAYDLEALQALGHCCNPNNNPGGSPRETSIAIATYGGQNFEDLAAFRFFYPYLTYNAELINVDGTPVPGDMQGTMDLEWAVAMANSFSSWETTAKVYVYQGANDQNTVVADVYNQILSDNQTRTFMTNWSCGEFQFASDTEFGNCQADTMNIRDSILTSMSGQGWTIVAATGDAGPTPACLAQDNVYFPASDPNVVAVGGTTLTQSLVNGSYESEAAWAGSNCNNGNGGGGGGISSYWNTPNYQSRLGLSGRAVPDIALNAGTPQNIVFQGQLRAVTSTSIAAAEMAGFFAQENAYLLSLGPNTCDFHSCAPIGNANYDVYLAADGLTPAYPFYDINLGCNDNDITTEFGLPYQCTRHGYDQATGWGSLNMLQLAWTINWVNSGWSAGVPTVIFNGPAVNKWYNSDQHVNWFVEDNASQGSNTFTGVAGFTGGWDSIPSYFNQQPTPGSGNSFYSGPRTTNAPGLLDLANSAQGCHTAHVRGWNNAGIASEDTTYGPICYDTVAPFTKGTLAGTLGIGGRYTSSVKVTLSAADASSGVASTYYSLDNSAFLKYAGPLTVSTPGAHVLHYSSKDVAGNSESNETLSFGIDSLTATTLSSSLNPSIYGLPVTFTAKVSVGFGGTATGYVTFKDGTNVLGTTALSGGQATLAIAGLLGGTHSITATYDGSTNDLNSTSAILTEKVNQSASTTSVASSLNPATHGQVVTFTATIIPAHGGSASGTVTFKDGSTILGTVSVNTSNNKAALGTSALNVATHSITAVYNGSTSVAPSNSTVLNETIK